MKRLSDLNIQTKRACFVGTKISMDDILNKEIIVEDFKIEDSTKKPGTKCLHLQVKVGDTQHVIFTSGIILMDQLIQAKEQGGIPLITTPVYVNKRFYKFT